MASGLILVILGGFETAGQLMEAIQLQLYIYNTYRIHLSLRTSPQQYLANQSLKVTNKVVQKMGYLDSLGV